VKILDPSMSTADIKAVLDRSRANRCRSSARDATLLFMPGTYGSTASPLNFKVGYYEESRASARRHDVTIIGTADVYTPVQLDGLLCLGEFLAVAVERDDPYRHEPKSGCHRAGNFWAVSQAPLRRVQIDNGFFTLMDFCTARRTRAGGFIS
jgi:hypothetical protein